MGLPHSMRAMVINPSGDLRQEMVDVPSLGPRDVLIEVAAVGLNRAELSQRQGRYQQAATVRPGPRIAGLEAAGRVVAKGSEVQRWEVGDRVASMCTGSYAEYVAVDERLPLPIPPELTWAEAAATPVAFMTAHDALITNGGLTPSTRLLVTGGSSNVGIACLQVAKVMRVATVIATCSGAKDAFVRSHGATDTIDHHLDSIVNRVRALTDDRGVDLVIDHIGASWFPDALDAIAVKGRFVSVGRLGATVAEVDLDRLARDRISIVGVSFRTRTLDEYHDVARRCVDDLWSYLSSGAIRPVVFRTFPLAQARDAQDLMASNEAMGKVVLEVAS